MVTLLIGKKGTGKTKKLISLANEAVAASTGNVVVIEKGSKLTYDVTHKARLIDTEQYLIAVMICFSVLSAVSAQATMMLLTFSLTQHSRFARRLLQALKPSQRSFRILPKLHQLTLFSLFLLMKAKFRSQSMLFAEKYNYTN